VKTIDVMQAAGAVCLAWMLENVAAGRREILEAANAAGIAIIADPVLRDASTRSVATRWIWGSLPKPLSNVLPVRDETRSFVVFRNWWTC